MSRPDNESILSHLSALAVLMRIGDWRIIVSDDPPTSEDALAQVHVTYTQETAIIRLAENFFDQSPEDQREALIHELVHCHLEPVAYSFGDAADELSPLARKMVASAFNKRIENATENLARIIAPAAPLPPWCE